YIYLFNLIWNPLIMILFLLGVLLVLLGIFMGCKGHSKTIFPLGIGSVLSVFSLFASLGINSPFYPSLVDMQSSLSIYNASSSYYTLSIMSYVSLLVPFVLGYIIYVWKAMDKEKLTKETLKNEPNSY
ncbi:MAG: cytochrome d ubiquinol oxidase subunit II, partial [Helicobacter sp.]|nr:cytochrome d ubiquinol oxidase subunit II [Helicobacter sp.]